MATDKQHIKEDLQFERKLVANPIKENPRHIPKIKWNCPPRFNLNPEWLVAAGEESTEASAQRNNHSVISTCASRPLYMDDDDSDGSTTPLIRLMPIEEDEEPSQEVEAKPSLTATSSNLNTLEPANGMAAAAATAAAAITAYLKLKDEAREVDNNLLIKFLSNQEIVGKLVNNGHGAADAVTAITSYIKCKEQGIDIDPELLVQFLSDPKTVEKLTKEHGGASSNTGCGQASMLSGSVPKTVTHSFPSFKAEVTVTKPTREHVPLPRAGAVPIGGPPVLPLPRATADPISIKKLKNDHRGHDSHLGKTAQFTGMSTLVAPSVSVPKSVPDRVLRMKRLVDEYGASDRKGVEVMPEPKPRPPVVPFPPLNTDEKSVLPRANLQPQDNVLQPLRTLSSDICRPAPFFRPPVPVPAPAPMPLANPLALANLLSTANWQDIANLLNLGASSLLHQNSSAAMPKRQKPCIYFNGPRGCVHGANCQYLHIKADRQTGAGASEQPPIAKRVKRDGGS